MIGGEEISDQLSSFMNIRAVKMLENGGDTVTMTADHQNEATTSIVSFFGKE